jgi:4,5-dihydroxyphthalate decarboxylase
VQEFVQTAALWIRGFLQHDHGVRTEDIDWYFGGYNEPDPHFKPRIELELPEKVHAQIIPGDQCIDAMLERGELDAVMSAREIAAPRLFADYRVAEAEYWKKTRIFPIMHVLVIRRDVYERDRWIAMNLFKAFEEARKRSMARVREFGLSHLPVAWMPDHTKQWIALAGDDFWPYGIEPNRPTLEAFFQYAHEQGVAKKRLRMEDVFAAETREQFKI